MKLRASACPLMISRGQVVLRWFEVFVCVCVAVWAVAGAACLREAPTD